MNGGASEYVASYMYNSYGGNINNYGGTANGDLCGENVTEKTTSTEYKMVYDEGTANESAAYELSKKYKGDAIYETSAGVRI